MKGYLALVAVVVACGLVLLSVAGARANQVPPGGGFPNFCLGHSGEYVWIYIGNTLVHYHCA